MRRPRPPETGLRPRSMHRRCRRPGVGRARRLRTDARRGPVPDQPCLRGGLSARLCASISPPSPSLVSHQLSPSLAGPKDAVLGELGGRARHPLGAAAALVQAANARLKASPSPVPGQLDGLAPVEPARGAAAPAGPRGATVEGRIRAQELDRCPRPTEPSTTLGAAPPRCGPLSESCRPSAEFKGRPDRTYRSSRSKTVAYPLARNELTNCICRHRNRARKRYL